MFSIKNQSVLIISKSSSSTKILLALFTIPFLPKVNINAAEIEQNAMMPVIGNELPFCKKLTIADMNPPTLICIKPIRADALPALLPKGAMESADALGYIKP